MELKWEFLEDGTLYMEDPVYEKTYGSYVLPPHIAGMFQTKEMIRLQKIKQTDFSYIDYPGLENDKRWRHSIGVAHLGNEVFNRFTKIFAENGIEADKETKEIIECVLAAHDIGHCDNSHHSDKLLKYSHELRTADILLGNCETGTQVNEYLTSKYPKEKIEQVVAILTKVTNHEKIDYSNLDPYIQLFIQILSSAYDIDKLDYTLGDSYYAGIPSGVDPVKLIDGLSANIDNSGNYRVVIKEKALRQGERLQIERGQNYRDVYYSISSDMMDIIAPDMFQMILEESDEVKQKLPPIFLKKMEAALSGTRTTTLEEELQMVDDVTEEAYKILREQARNPILRYLCDIPTVRHDLYAFNTNKNIKTFRNDLQAIFPDRDLSKTMALFITDKVCKIKKPTEDFLIEKENGEIVSTEEKEDSIIKPQSFHVRRINFSLEILRLELGLSKEEFARYRESIENFIESMQEKTEEFQARYTVKNRSLTTKDIVQLLQRNGFHYINSSKSQNIDDYYDTKGYELLKAGRELRGRKTGDKISAMYKSPTRDQSTTYTSRQIFEATQMVQDTSLLEVKKALMAQVPELQSYSLEDIPMMHATTNRTKMYFIRNGKRICVAFDETLYNNRWINKKADDVMLEIQIGRGTSKLILKSIEQIFDMYPEEFRKCQESKVLRGCKLTQLQKKKEQPLAEKEQQQTSGDRQGEPNEIEREKKMHFSESDREKLESLLPEILQQIGFEQKEDDFKLSDQMDYYFDTPSLYYGKSKEEPSLRTRESTNGKLEATYKVPQISGKFEPEREEKKGTTPKTTTAEDFLKAMQENGITVYPNNLELSTKVVNHRKKLMFHGNGMEIELAIDYVININAKINTRKKAEKGEFEIEIKSAEITVEEQRKALKEIIDTIVEQCARQEIKLTPSKHSKYVQSLLGLGLIKEREPEVK